jgi:hypothetical protein
MLRVYTERSGQRVEPAKKADLSLSFGRERNQNPHPSKKREESATRQDLHGESKYQILALTLMAAPRKQGMLTSGLSDFAAQHWVVGGITASLMWFIAGNQSLSNKKPDAAIAWQCVAVMLIIIVGFWEVVKQEWIGLVFAIGVLYFEIRSIRRISASQGPQR